MQVRMEVEGLDRLRTTSAAFSRQLDGKLRPAVKDTAQEVRERAKNKARAFSIGGFYPASIRHLIKSGGLSAEVYSVAKTAQSIEQGRKAGEIVKFGLILRWVQRRGIVRGINIATRKVVSTKKGRASAKPNEILATREIVAAIKAHGTRALPHLLPAAQETTAGWKRRVNDAAKQALRTVKGV